MSKKIKIEVHSKFTLITPEKVGADNSYQTFEPGVHTVSEETAKHPWTLQHAKVAGDGEVTPSTKEIEEEEIPDEDLEEEEIPDEEEVNQGGRKGRK